MAEMKLIYDIASCPMTSGMRLEDVADIYQEHGIVFYDSQENGGNEIPQLINIPEGTEVQLVDLSTEEGKEVLNKITE